MISTFSRVEAQRLWQALSLLPESALAAARVEGFRRVVGPSRFDHPSRELCLGDDAFAVSWAHEGPSLVAIVAELCARAGAR